MKKLWGGRFEKSSDTVMESFHSSISFDCRLYKQDIEGSLAHAKMLAKQGIISNEDAESIATGLNSILADIEEGKVEFSQGAEDIHMNIESLLTERIGDAGKRLHTARSRNDQVALDMRMYMKKSIDDTSAKLGILQETLIETAEAHIETVMPGYTHLQKAQPITLAHHILAYVEMFARDKDRLQDAKKRTDIMPLGSGALATSTYPIDRNFVAEELGFSQISNNSLDAVSDRDFCIEYLSCASMIMMHLSRFCEELILWASSEFSFIEIDDAYSTGSSIMPQKKNPDVAELIRGKTGRVYGDLMALLSIMKSLPLAYNKDMQEDKEATFDAIDTVLGCLELFTRMFATLKFNSANMRASAALGFTNATDAADYLVKHGLPFRSAHEVIGKLVLDCIRESKAIENCTLAELKEYSPLFDEDVFEAISPESCVRDRKAPGGPAPSAIREALAFAKERNR